VRLLAQRSRMLGRTAVANASSAVYVEGLIMSVKRRICLLEFPQFVWHSPGSRLQI